MSISTVSRELTTAVAHGAPFRAPVAAVQLCWQVLDGTNRPEEAVSMASEKVFGAGVPIVMFFSSFLWTRLDQLREVVSCVSMPVWGK